MRPPFVEDEILLEFFKARVDEALAHQHQPAHELTRFYLVQLLATRTRSDAAPTDRPEALALWFGRALEAVGGRQRTEWRALGDHTLFVAGFFSDSLSRSVVDVDYYAALGGYAYQQLSASSDTLAPAFAELGSSFLRFADVLTEVSEHSTLTSDSDLLRLYERWVQHGSRRNGDRLIRRGVIPAPGAVDAGGRVQ